MKEKRYALPDDNQPKMVSEPTPVIMEMPPWHFPRKRWLERNLGMRTLTGAECLIWTAPPMQKKPLRK